MSPDIGDMFFAGQQQFLLIVLVFLRVGAAMALLPVVGERSLPGKVRLLLAVGFTLIVTPVVENQIQVSSTDLPHLLLAAIGEIVTGLAIGLSLRLFVFALQIAGSMAAQATSLSQLFGGAAVDPQPAIGHIFVVGGLALAVSFGLHVQMASYLILSYDLIAPAMPLSAQDFSRWEIVGISRAFALAFSLAAPFVIASLIYNIALGAINRAMPQLMVSFVGAPAITAGGLLLLWVAAPLILTVWYGELERFLSNPLGVW